MNREEHIEFLQGLNDDYLMKHIRAYVRNGLDEKAARAMQERDRRKNDEELSDVSVSIEERKEVNGYLNEMNNWRSD